MPVSEDLARSFFGESLSFIDRQKACLCSHPPEPSSPRVQSSKSPLVIKPLPSSTELACNKGYRHVYWPGTQPLNPNAGPAYKLYYDSVITAQEQILCCECLGQALASIPDKEDVEISVSFYELYKAMLDTGFLLLAVQGASELIVHALIPCVREKIRKATIEIARL